MMTKIAFGSLVIISLVLSNGCSYHSSEPPTIYNNGSYGANTISNDNEVDFNHESYVGYGGVNVYDFDGVN